MPPSTRKKVVVRKIDAALIKGYADSDGYLNASGIELLDQEGHMVSIPIEEVKGVYFVRDFEGDPSRPERKVFQSRPKLDGLWIRMTFRDREVLEGLLDNNLLRLGTEGFLVTPADLGSNNTRVFEPRGALGSVEVLGVIINGSIRRASRRPAVALPRTALTSAQIGLFASSETSPSKS